MWGTMPMLLAMFGCGKIEEQARVRRVWEMQDHEESYRAARDAIARGDLKSAQQAGVELAAPDPVPGLPPGSLVHLAAVRAGGKGLSTAASLADAATDLVAITTNCAACHTAQGVSVPPLVDEASELLWTALVFESEPSWQAGLAKRADSGPLSAAPGWPERRAAMATALLQGRP